MINNIFYLKVAIKFIDKSKISDEIDKKRINLEIKILKNTYHYNIIKLYEVIETEDNICMIMEYAEGGELYNYLFEKKYLSEEESRKIFHQLIDAISYLHQMGICHRDLKLENILFSSKKKNYIKIIDFRLSNLYLTGVSSDNPSLAFGADFLDTPCGTPAYIPPEMILGCKYDGLLADIWSAGIILYSMLCGSLPFDDPNEEKLYSKIIKGDFYFPSNIDISDEAKLLIKKILVVNPRLRANIKDIRKDPWFIKNYEPILGLFISIRDIPICSEIIEEVEKYGYTKNEIIDNVKNNRHNKITTIYYLLVNKFRNEGKEIINDLISNTFKEYLEEQDLKNKLIKKGEKPISLKIMKYKSKPLFDLEDEENNNNYKKYDLEYFQSLIVENDLIKTEYNNEKIEGNKNEGKNINIYSLKTKIYKKDGSLDNIQDKLTSKKNRIDRIKRIGKFYKGENSFKGKKPKNINISDFNNKYFYSTSINNKKRNKKNIFVDKNNIKLSYNKRDISDYEQFREKLHKTNCNGDLSKNIKKIIMKPRKENKKIINETDKLLEIPVGKISKLSLNKKIFNKFNLNIKNISFNKIGSLINKDIINTVDKSNLKINKIKKIREKNLKKISNNSLKNKKYFELFNNSQKTRNYNNMELNNGIKTSRQFHNKYVLKSSSYSKSKSSRSKSYCSTERNKNRKIITYNFEKMSKNKNYFNIKINNRNSRLLTEGNRYSKNKHSLLNNENKNSKIKSNTISKKKCKSKIKSSNKKKINSKSKDENSEKILIKREAFSNKRKNEPSQKVDNGIAKNTNYNKMKNLESNNLNNFKMRNKRNNIEEINSHVNTIKSILTERNNHINNIINNNKYDFIEKTNLNNKKVKIFSKNLQKIIPSLKGLTIKEKKPLKKKSLINLIDGSNKSKDKESEKRRNNVDILKRMNNNIIIKNLDANIKKNKRIGHNNNLNKKNKLNNNIVIKIRKISPINQNKKFISISNNSNIIGNDISKINPIKIKGIKTIKVYNNSKYSNKSKTCRIINDYDDRINYNNNFKNIIFEEFNSNFGLKICNKERQEQNNNYRSRLNLKKNSKTFRNLNEMLISILTKNKINVIKTSNNEYICKKGDNKMILELKKRNNLDDCYVSINNISINQKEFELFKKQIINSIKY